MSRMLFALLLGLSSTSLASPASWPQFRGPNGSGVSDGKPVIHFGPNSNVVWKIEIPAGASSACIVANRLFLTAADGEKLETLCIDRANGKVLWRKGAPVEKIESFHKQDGSPAASTG